MADDIDSKYEPRALIVNALLLEEAVRERERKMELLGRAERAEFLLESCRGQLHSHQDARVAAERALERITAMYESQIRDLEQNVKDLVEEIDELRNQGRK